MVLRLGLVGCGKWSNVVISEICKNRNFELKYVVCRNDNKVFSKSIKVYRTVEEMINSKNIDCLYVASSPKVNIDVIKLLIYHKLPVILEKPITNSYQSIINLTNIIKKHKIQTIPNLSNIFSECTDLIENFIKKNHSNIKKIIIIEGGKGPFRKNINPVWDWGFHSLSLIFKLFKKDHISEFKYKEIKQKSILGKGLVSRFNFTVNNFISVKIITGNLFHTKKRFFKIILSNKEFLICDFVKHEVYINNILVHKNLQTPLESLLNNFENIIKKVDYFLSNELLDISCKTIKILDKFNKC